MPQGKAGSSRSKRSSHSVRSNAQRPRRTCKRLASPQILVYIHFMKHVIDPEGLRLPIKLDATSNGEFAPVPLSPVNRAGNRLAHAAAAANAKRLGMNRRDFLVSACGAASALVAFNAANAAAGKRGGFFEPDRKQDP